MSWMIKIEDVSKMYRLGLVNSASLQDDFKRAWYKFRGKEDPFLKIGEENKRDSKGGEYVWALKDINFEVNQGEVLGIIGKNGAGKSTLLKLLSKVTKPTSGSIKTKGRIASLLEVGTGFHPELTGKENIFLNGAILGMKKHEIKKKYDEIVNFSGCERYIDTPVKRYSSGMYVRLAFAVAAHLEPEILVVDEVLAVGDAEFQQKAIGKIKNISEGEGRTVLFVSHNMASIKSLCDRCILLENGKVKKDDTVASVIENYLLFENTNKEDSLIAKDTNRVGLGYARFLEFFISDDKYNLIENHAFYQDDINFVFKIYSEREINDILIDIRFISMDGIEFSHVMNSYSNQRINIQKGTQEIRAIVKNNFQPGLYGITIGIHHANGTTIDYIENVRQFVVNSFSRKSKSIYSYSWKTGYVREESKWSIL